MLIDSNARLSRIDSIIFSVDEKHLEEAQCFPYLGLVINKNLTWEDHVDHMCNKINQKLGLLRRIKSCFPLSARITFLILMFYSFLIKAILYGATLLLWPSYKYYTTRPRDSF